MILQFIRNNRTYDFNTAVAFPGDIDYPIYLVGTVGFGLAPSHQLTQRGPFQQGDTYVGFRLDPRIIQLPLVVEASSPEDSFTKRAKLTSLFRMNDDAVQIRIAWTDGATTYDRTITGRVFGQLSLDTDSHYNAIRTTVQIRCNDPTWVDTTQNSVVLSGLTSGTPTPYPKPYPVTYGANGLDKYTTFNYDGTWESYPIIQVTGPVTDLALVDTLGNIISFNTAVPAGQLWTIDLSYGVYTVYDQDGVNQFSALTAVSDPVNWKIYPESDLVPYGVNTIGVSGTGTDADSNITMYYYSRYIGV